MADSSSTCGRQNLMCWMRSSRRSRYLRTWVRVFASVLTDFIITAYVPCAPNRAARSGIHIALAHLVIYEALGDIPPAHGGCHVVDVQEEHQAQAHGHHRLGGMRDRHHHHLTARVFFERERVSACFNECARALGHKLHDDSGRNTRLPPPPPAPQSLAPT